MVSSIDVAARRNRTDTPSLENQQILRKAQPQLASFFMRVGGFQNSSCNDFYIVKGYLK
jgi:hypothetical protein